MSTDGNIQRLTLSKSERLSSAKAIEKLFATGESFIKFPLRVVYALSDERLSDGNASRMVVSVPKRRFKHAVSRNRIKRLVREAFRHEKSIIAQADVEQCIDIAFIFIDNDLPTQERVRHAVSATMTKIVQEINKPQ